ncbi:MAG: peptidylprolyl isomerase [Fusobacteriaceae bacterium]
MTKNLSIKFSLLIALVIFVVGCSNSKIADDSNYNDIRVTFVTSQGDITFYLYPEAAPVSVANFINLAKRGFYDNTKIHRAIPNFMAQGGTKSGDGTEGPGYTIPDEIVNWLDFFQGGMLAMANAGPGTGGAQFFMTMQPAEWLNGLHTVFGETVTDTDMTKISKLEVGDIIKEVVFSGNVDLILSLNKAYLDDWNPVLDKKFPQLAKYTIKPISEYGDIPNEYEKQVRALYANNENTRRPAKVSPVPRFIAFIFNSFSMKAKLDSTQSEVVPLYESEIK